jgi:hypothetical protein
MRCWRVLGGGEGEGDERGEEDRIWIRGCERVCWSLRGFGLCFKAGGGDGESEDEERRYVVSRG